MKLTIEKMTPGLLVHQVDGDELWVSSEYTVCRSDDSGESFQKVVDLPVFFLWDLAGRCRLTSRGLRLGVRSLRKLNSGTVLAVADRKIFRFSGERLDTVHQFRRGIGPLREGWCQDDGGNIYLGEYFLNRKREPVTLLKSENDGKSWRIIHTFSDIRHIHCVQYDPFAGRVWVGTGDADSESRLLFSPDRGATWTNIGSGDQRFRAVSLLFTSDYVYWGTDAPSRQNHIYRYSRQSGVVTAVVEIGGPVHYSAISGNGLLVFATTAEGKSEGRSGAWDNKAHLWASDNGTDWQDIAGWGKDGLPYILGYGRILFAHGQYRDKLFFTPQCVKQVDSKLVQARIE